jgi:hypothetical protein
MVGCRDSPTDPLQGLVAPETDLAALSIELPLPAPVLDDASTAEAAPAEAVQAWRRSWEKPVLEGRRMREALYPRLAELQVGLFDRAELTEQLALLGAGVRKARQLESSSLPQFLKSGIEHAEAAWHRGERAASAGSLESAWEALLRGADNLREVGPEAVARTAVSDVEARLGRSPADGPYSEKELERIRHLVHGSRQALEEAAWGLAIRRAYYAGGLLDGNG